MPLFIRKNFISAAGLALTWKIECDALTPDDWHAIAAICTPRLPFFGRVVAVPKGGIFLASEFERYVSPREKRVLVVDDVWTTGTSMAKVGIAFDKWIGFVAFARGELPDHVFAFMTTTF